MSNAAQFDAEAAIAALALLSGRRGTVSSVRDLLEACGSQKLTCDDIFSIAGVPKGGLNATASEVRRKVDQGLAVGIDAIPINSERYPTFLRKIQDAPAVIFVRGNLSVLSGLPGVAIVGTRRATKHGLTIAERLAQVIGDAGYAVVSGLALGIDAAAHEGALKSSSPTIAVLAHGLEKATPRANAHLADRILAGGGLWVSEHLLGTPARPEQFVQRNRIQVGLSAASIIVEGEERSGSMTQAEYCLRNKRTLFAVLPTPGTAVATQSSLPSMLVSSRGAHPIGSKDDYPGVLDLIRRKRDSLLSATS